MQRIAHTDNFLMANGKKYIIHDTIPLARFMIFEELEIEVATGSTFKQIHWQAKEAYQQLNSREGNLADAAVLLNNMIHGVSRNLNKRVNPVFMLLCLFICGEDEDRTTFVEAEQLEKIADWKTTDIPVSDFFLLASSLVNGLQQALNESSPDTLTQELEAMNQEQSQD